MLIFLKMFKMYTLDYFSSFDIRRLVGEALKRRLNPPMVVARGRGMVVVFWRPHEVLQEIVVDGALSHVGRGGGGVGGDGNWGGGGEGALLAVGGAAAAALETGQVSPDQVWLVGQG